MRRQISRVKHPVRRDFRDRPHAAFRDFGGHDAKGLFPFLGKTRRHVTKDEPRQPVAMREREGERNRAAKAVSHQDRVAADLEGIESLAHPRRVGVDRRRDRLRAVKAGKIEQCHAKARR